MLVAPLWFCFLGSAAPAAELVLDGLVARITILPEPRSDIYVVVRPGGSGLPSVSVTQEGERTIVTSGVEVGACAQSGATMRVGLRDGRQVEMGEAPEIIVRAPRSFRVEGADSALIGRIERSEDLHIRQAGCAFWDIGEVVTLQADMSGGAHLTASGAATANLAAAAGAAVTIGPVANLVAEASAGGMIGVAAVNGAVEASASGGGRIEIGSGRATTFRAVASSGGRILHRGEIVNLHATAVAGGQIEVSQAESILSRSVSAGGQVIVGD